MKSKYFFIAGAVAALAAVIYYQYAKNNFTVSYGGMQVNNISADYTQVDLTLTFNLKSQEGVQANVTGIQFNIYSNGVLVGTGTQAQPIAVPGNGTVVPLIINTTVNLTSALCSVVSSLTGMLTGGSGLSIQIQGAVQAGVALPIISYFSLNYPFNITDHISGL